jgi:hypothetical protein
VLIVMKVIGKRGEFSVGGPRAAPGHRSPGVEDSGRWRWWWRWRFSYASRLKTDHEIAKEMLDLRDRNILLSNLPGQVGDGLGAFGVGASNPLLEKVEHLLGLA